ncbi:hypothetical protein, partial [Actinomycetospora callitridis]|uniref:hypothetical protein n=1 Tax=Actinomycetospora callitridis TaxID=913944 RepID=UPI002366EAC7
MKGRRSSRSAAVVLAGCVGLAVIAPGLALAAEIPGVSTAEGCLAANGDWDPATLTCDDGTGPATTDGTTTDGTTTDGTTTDGTTTDGTTTDGTTTDGTTTDGTTT